MNSDQFQGMWSQIKGKVKETWGRLTDNDLATIGGRMDQLVGKLQQHYGYGREEAEREVRSFCDRCG